MAILHENLDKSIFKQLILVGIVVASYEGIYFWFFTDAIGVRVWSSPIVMGLLTVFYFLVDKVRQFEVLKHVFFPILYSFIVADYFTNGGFWGVVPIDIAIFFMFTACLYRGKALVVFLGFDVLMLFVFLYIHFFLPELAPDLRPKELLFLDILNIFSRVFMLSCFGWIIKVQYDRKMDHILHLYNELGVLNEQIIIQKEEIQAANESLLDRVNERTEKLQQVNKQLSDYAFFNSHKVRGPLARIIGLNKVIQMHYEQTGHEIDPDMDLYLSYLNNCTTELDRVIFDINETLKKEKFGKLK